MKKLQDKFDCDGLAKLLGIPAYEPIECYCEHPCDCEQDAWSAWSHGVEHVARRLFSAHKLLLEERKGGGWRVVPATTWQDAANSIRHTINGVGMFEFASLAEFLGSGPWTARQAVLENLHWIRDYPAVYGEGSPKTMFYAYMR